jgi:hypothetical protein
MRQSLAVNNTASNDHPSAATITQQQLLVYSQFWTRSVVGMATDD